MQAASTQDIDPHELSPVELQEELDKLTDRLYNQKFTKKDLETAQSILKEMDRRNLELPGKPVGLTTF